MDIEANRELKMEHVLSVRKKITQEQMAREMHNIQQFIKEHGLTKTGPVTTTTFAIDQSGDKPVMDIEILIPLDRDFATTGDFVCKKCFHLVNAVCIHHIGNPAMLQNSYDELTAYIKQNHLQPITSGYNVTVNDPKPGEPLDNCKVDVYIGVNPSML